MALVSQEPTLFNDSIFANIAMGKPGAFNCINISYKYKSYLDNNWIMGSYSAITFPQPPFPQVPQWMKSLLHPMQQTPILLFLGCLKGACGVIHGLLIFQKRFYVWKVT